MEYKCVLIKVDWIAACIALRVVGAVLVACYGLAECDQIYTGTRSSFTVGTAPGMATLSTSKNLKNTFGL